MKTKDFQIVTNVSWIDLVDTQFKTLKLAVRKVAKYYVPDMRMNHSLNMIRNPYYIIAFNKTIEFQRYVDTLKFEHGKWN